MWWPPSCWWSGCVTGWCVLQSCATGIRCIALATHASAKCSQFLPTGCKLSMKKILWIAGELHGTATGTLPRLAGNSSSKSQLSSAKRLARSSTSLVGDDKENRVRQLYISKTISVVFSCHCRLELSSFLVHHAGRTLSLWNLSIFFNTELEFPLSWTRWLQLCSSINWHN